MIQLLQLTISSPFIGLVSNIHSAIYRFELILSDLSMFVFGVEYNNIRNHSLQSDIGDYILRLGTLFSVIKITCLLTKLWDNDRVLLVAYLLSKSDEYIILFDQSAGCIEES